MVWALSPLIAFFISPILGSLSDRCSSRFGRRRPVILLLSIGLLMGLILTPYGADIGKFLGDDGSSQTVNSTSDEEGDSGRLINKSSGSFYWAIMFTVLGTILLDFNADNCQNPSRAYLLDMCIPEEQAHALSTFTIMAGFGGCMGYALGAINWDETIFSNIIGDNIKTVFTLVTIIFVIAMFCTMTSFREIPLKLLETDEMLRPVTQLAVKKERERLKTIDNSNKLPSTSVTYETETNLVDTTHQTAIASVNREPSSHSFHHSSSSDDEDDESDETITMMMYLKSIIFMPKSLRLLCVTHCLAWMGHILYCLYFTDFVGEVVFGGDPAGSIDSPEYQLYDEGIRFGCWGMALYAFSCAIYSMLIENLIKKYSTKFVYVAGMLSFATGMALLGKNYNII
jgi:solute carrier family 45, member 1/2/4